MPTTKFRIVIEHTHGSVNALFVEGENADEFEVLLVDTDELTAEERAPRFEIPVGESDSLVLGSVSRVVVQRHDGLVAGVHAALREHIEEESRM